MAVRALGFLFFLLASPADPGALANYAHADELPPHGILYPTNGDVSMTWMDCRPKDYSEPRGRILCTFRVASVTPPPSALRVANELTRVLIWFLKAKPEDFREMCNDYDSATPYTTSTRAGLARMRQACAVGATREKHLQLQLAFGAETIPYKCKVDSHLYEAEFQRLDDKTWISNDGPAGICNRIQVITLTKEDDRFWKYKEVSTIPERAGAKADDLCGPPRTATAELGWRNKSRDMDCRHWSY